MFPDRRRACVSAALAISAMFVSFLASRPALAEATGTVRAVSLPEALAYARAHQPAARAALARVREQQALAEAPRAQWRPSLGLTAQLLEGTANNTTASYVSVDPLDIPRIGGTPSASGKNAGWRPYASTFAAVGLNQEVFDFGRIAAQTAAADAQVGVTSHEADAVRLDIDLNVAEAYFAVNAARSVLRAAEDAYQRSKVHRDFAKAGVGTGLRSPIELTRAEADLTRFDTGRIRARGGLAAAQVVLAASIGAPEPALDAADVPVTPQQLPAIAEALQQAQQKDPRLQEAMARLRAQEAQSGAIAALMRPDLQLTGTLSGRAGGATPSSATAGAAAPCCDGYVPSVPNWNVGLVLSWPLFDPTVRARAQASRVGEEVRREEIDDAREQLVAAVEQAYVTVDVARQALPALRRELEAAAANYAQADARFKAGMGTSVELADAEALRTDADIRVAIGTFDLAKARAAFGRVIAEGL
jgi:outer membrane protein TolC